jgi:glutaredoxin
MLRLTVVLALCTVAPPLFAVTVYECEDAQGDRTFQDICPPGTTPVLEKQFYTGSKKAKELEAVRSQYPVTLYSTPTCDACDLVRSYLQNRGVPFTEKDVSNNAELQQELLSKSGGLTVPATFIGDSFVAGYNKVNLKSQLDNAGYPEIMEPGAVTAPAAPVAEGAPETPSPATLETESPAAESLPAQP